MDIETSYVRGGIKAHFSCSHLKFIRPTVVVAVWPNIVENNHKLLCLRLRVISVACFVPLLLL